MHMRKLFKKKIPWYKVLGWGVGNYVSNHWSKNLGCYKVARNARGSGWDMASNCGDMASMREESATTITKVRIEEG
jgi:hypothetical protein